VSAAALRLHPALALLCGVAASAGAACTRDRSPTRPIRFLHTFGAAETELANATIAGTGLGVDGRLVPFARGQQVIRDQLTAGRDCPDLMRIDATWLPSLVAAHLLQRPPEAATTADWTPAARELAQQGGTWWALPQAVDGLVVVRATGTPAPPSTAIADLAAAARAARTSARPFPLEVRVDSYWFVPWLRAAGGDLAPERFGDVAAVAAVDAFATTVRELVAPEQRGTDVAAEARRWNDGEIAYWIAGPWQLAAVRARDDLAITALTGAPRGGQLLAVPACAAQPDAGWRLAEALTAPAAERAFADAFATIPTRASALADAPAAVRALATALDSAQLLPRSPITPLLFDDLNAALAAAVEGDATAAEVVAGVRRGWQRQVPR